MASTGLELTVTNDGKTSTFTLTEDSLLVKRVGDRKWPIIETSLRNVLWAELAEDSVEVSLLASKKAKSPLSLIHIAGRVDPAVKDAASTFTQALMRGAYRGIKTRRNLKVIVNPHSGPGRAVSLYNKRVEPILRSARCTIDVIFTTHAKHAIEIAKTLPLDKFDAIVSMSGDGLAHELLNGFAAHAEPMKALQIPIAPIPTGSGNGTALNILGFNDGRDVAAAALNAIKGRPMKVDVFSVTQDGKRTLSYMSQTLGLMADLDLGTENLRFMGSSRFVVGYLQGIIKNKACPVKVSIKVAESDKKSMLANLHSSLSKAKEEYKQIMSQPDLDLDVAPGPDPVETPTTLPELKHSSSDGEGWITFDKPLLYLYAGKGPYVAPELMQFPVSLPDDGLIDVAVQAIGSRKLLLQIMDGADRGEQFWIDAVNYYKAYAYRVETLSKKGHLSIDGEAYPFHSFEVEVHHKLATFMSPCGHYQVDFNGPKKP